MRATLTYHSIDDSGSPISVSPRAFDAHLAWLTSGRVRVVPLGDIATASGDAVAITFDDGFANTREPIQRLRAAGLPVTVFIVSGHVGRTNAWGDAASTSVPTLPLLSWEDLAKLRSLDVGMGAHTRTHAALTALTGTALDEEVFGCRADLTERLGIAPAHFAYPYGDVDARVAGVVGRGYTWGHTTVFEPVADGIDRARLPRLDMYYFQAPGALEAWGTPQFARTIGWIGARRLARNVLVGGTYPGGRRRWSR